MSPFIKKVVQLSASAKVTIICLLVMVVMVIWGTLFEASYGLLAAREKFFHSWIFWTYYIPFPGIKLIALILLWNLVFRSVEFLRSPLRNSGLILIHLGVAFLLSGALFAAKFSKEYFLPLHEGETSQAAYSYEFSEIAVFKRSNQFTDAFIYDSVPVRDLKNGQKINLSKTGFSFTIVNIHRQKTAGIR
jgi:cytochrome c biogenesis factor